MKTYAGNGYVDFRAESGRVWRAVQIGIAAGFMLAMIMQAAGL